MASIMAASPTISASFASATTALPATMSSSNQGGIIAGGVIAGIALFAIAGFLIHMYERRARERHAFTDLAGEAHVQNTKQLADLSPPGALVSDPPYSTLPEMATVEQNALSDSSTIPRKPPPASILRRPAPATTPGQVTLDSTNVRRGPGALRFLDTDRLQPPGPLHLVGSPATDFSSSPVPWKLSATPATSSKTFKANSGVNTVRLSSKSMPSPSRTAPARSPSPHDQDTRSLRSAPPSSFPYAENPFRDSQISNDSSRSHARKSSQTLPPMRTPSPAMIGSPLPDAPSPAVHSRPPSTVANWAPPSRQVSLRRAPSSTARAGLPTNPRPTVVIPSPSPIGSASLSTERFYASDGFGQSMETPVYPELFSPLADPRYSVDMSQTVLSRTTSARELHRAPTSRAAPRLWRYPTARAPNTGGSMV